jgi:protein gp37
MTKSLTSAEQIELAKHEAAIERGLKTFVDVGNALLAIRDARLYRQTHRTFEDYCQDRWDLTRSYANEVIRAANVVGNLEGIPSNLLPQAVNQVRPIAALSPDNQRKAWQEAVDTAPDGKITGQHVASVAVRYVDTDEPAWVEDYETGKDILIDRNGNEIDPETGEIGQSAQPRQQTKQEYITLTQWNDLDHDDQIMTFEVAGDRTFNSQKNDNIEWAQWSWNPITGCKHDCPYCYARDIANRFYEPKFEPSLWPQRLTAPFNTQVPGIADDQIGFKNVFTCSMADLFGRWVPREWIEGVLDVVRSAPQWNFLFLTKFPIRLSEFEFPDNAWVGTTVDCQARVKNAENAFRKVKAAVKWLSCEPLLEPLEFSDLGMFQWIVLGGASSSTQTPEWHPPREWVTKIEAKAYEVGCMIYEKTNLFAPTMRLREYPGQKRDKSATLPDALHYLPSIERSS